MLFSQMTSSFSGIFRLADARLISKDSLNCFQLFLFQPPAFPRETRESIKEYIEEKYLTPRLDQDEFSPEKAGRQWDFDWFGMSKIPLEPSLPRSAMVPEWELPFRRSKGLDKGRWEPRSVQVCSPI